MGDPHFVPRDVHVRRWEPEVPGFVAWLNDLPLDERSWEDKFARGWIDKKISAKVIESMEEAYTHGVNWRSKKAPTTLLRVVLRYLRTWADQGDSTWNGLLIEENEIDLAARYFSLAVAYAHRKVG